MSYMLDEGLAVFVGLNTVPFHGEDAIVEKHYVSKRGRRQKEYLSHYEDEVLDGLMDKRLSQASHIRFHKPANSPASEQFPR